jgi:hypothetical protein
MAKDSAGDRKERWKGTTSLLPERDVLAALQISRGYLHLDQAIVMGSTRPKLLEKTSLPLERTGFFSAALRCGEGAITQAPGYPDAWFVRGLTRHYLARSHWLSRFRGSDRNRWCPMRVPYKDLDFIQGKPHLALACQGNGDSIEG